MADFTPNYNLKKPLRTEYYNVADANGNSDIVDTQLKAVNDRVDLVEGEVDALELGKVDKVVGQGLSDENYTLVEKNKVANLPDDTNAQLAEKVQGFKIKNEVVNGDFSQGTSNITDVTGGTLSLVDGRPRNTGNGVLNRQQLGVNISPTVIGRKYYYRLIVKCSGNPTSFRFHIGEVLQINGSLVANVETIKSEVITATGTPSNAYAYVNYADNITQSGKTLDIDNLVIVDLTNLFGAGNEPSKVQMDELMKVIPNQWWDGELTLTQKQFITWQLNLIRKNTNAIIALGGTIV